MQIGFLGLLTILFIGLKLTGYIAWSWWLVFVPIIFVGLIRLLIFMFMLMYAYFKR